MELRLLGPLELVGGDGQPITLPAGKPRALLGLLGVASGTVLSVDRIVDVLWFGRPPATAGKVVQGYVSRLRKLLPDGVLLTRTPGYELRLDEWQLDLTRFERLRREAAATFAAGRHQESLQLLQEGLALWRGPPLADVADELDLPGEVARLEESRLTALEERFETELALGRGAELVADLEGLVAAHPLRERLRHELMVALYRADRQADALSVYQETRAMLVDELGLEPSQSLQRLERAILRQDPALVHADTAPASVPPPSDLGLPAQVRKTVTVLVWEVVASTEAGERLDPESRSLIMGRYFESAAAVVRRNGGTIERFTGEAGMAVFGVPLLHEDDAVRALRAAAELRVGLAGLNRGLEPGFRTTLELQIGVDTGEVVTGSPERLVIGDVVNAAARLQRSAAPGEILLGAATLGLARDVVTAEKLETAALKSDDGIEAFRLTMVRPDAPKAARRLDVPMVGRADVLRRLEDAFSSAVNERSCRLCTVVGPAGVGKSRLADAFLARVAATVVRGRCLSYGEGITYWPVAEVVEQLGAHDELLAASPGAATAIRGALGQSEASTSDEIAWAVRKLLEASAAERPLVVVFDDVHWGETTFLDLVEHVAYLARDAPILLLCLARPELIERRADWGSGSPNATRVVLDPLDALETDELIQHLLAGEELESDLLARIRAASAGNPLFVEEMLAMVLESGTREVIVPPTIKALLAARLDQLNPAERAVLGRASVEGELFHRGAVEAMSVPTSPVGRQLVALVRKELVRPAPAQLPGEDGYRFRHLLIRDSAYEALPKAERAELHVRFAAWLEERRVRVAEQDEIIAYHLEQAHEYLVSLGPAEAYVLALGRRAAGRLSAAGGRAFARGDMGAASNLLRRAVRLIPELDSGRLALLTDLSEALMEIGEFDLAELYLDEAANAAQAADDARLVADAVLTRLLVQHFTTEDLAAWRATVAHETSKLIPLLEELDAHAELAKAWRLTQFVYGPVCQWGKQVEAAQHGLRHAQLAGNRRLEARLASSYVMGLCEGPMPVAEAIRRTRDIIDGQPPDRQAEAMVRCLLGYLLAMDADFDAARDEYGRGAELLDDLAKGVMSASATIAAARIELLASNPEEATRTLQALYDSLGQLGERYFRPLVGALLAHALLAQGAVDQASNVVTEADEQADADDTETQVLLRSVRARLCAAADASELARELAREALQLTAAADAPGMRADALVALADVLTATGSASDAAAALAEARALYEQKGNRAAAAQLPAAAADAA